MDLTDPTSTGTIHIHWVVPFPLPLTRETMTDWVVAIDMSRDRPLSWEVTSDHGSPGHGHDPRSLQDP